MHHLDVASCQCMSTTLTLSCLSSRECDMTLHALARYARPSVLAFCNGRRSSDRACLGAVCDCARSPADLVVCSWHSSRLFFCFVTAMRRQREIGRTARETERRRLQKQRQSGDMQMDLCAAFRRFYPFVECGLIVNETTVYLDFIDRPLLQILDGQTIEVIFTRATDMRHVDRCFRGPKASFEEDMREGPAAE